MDPVKIIKFLTFIIDDSNSACTIGNISATLCFFKSIFFSGSKRDDQSKWENLSLDTYNIALQLCLTKIIFYGEMFKEHSSD